MHAWKIYAIVFSACLLLSAIARSFLFMKRRDLVSPNDLLESAIALAAVPALFGFANQQAYRPHALWIVLCIVLYALSIYHFFTPKMKKLYRKGAIASIATIAAELIVGAPALWALARYSFFEPSLWS